MSDANLVTIAAIDINGDGIEDLDCGSVLADYAEYGVYYGSSHIADSAYKYPDDSIANVPNSMVYES